MIAVLDTYATADQLSAPVMPVSRRVPEYPPRFFKRRLSRPQYFLFGDIEREWKVDPALAFEVEQDESGAFVVSSDSFLVYGEGDTEEEAIRDFATSLVDLYELLNERASSNALDQAELARLQVYLHRLELETGYDAQAS